LALIYIPIAGLDFFEGLGKNPHVAEKSAGNQPVFQKTASLALFSAA
jgi:hypothetical protein